MSDSGSDFTRNCLIVFFSQNRFKVHGLPASLEQGNYSINIHTRLYTSLASEPDPVDIVIFDIADEEEAKLAVPIVEKYSYVVNRWHSFSWRYPVFDISVRLGLNAMGRRAMNHRRSLYKLMVAIDHELKRLSASLFSVLNPKNSEEVQFSDFAQVAEAVGVAVTDAEFQEIVNIANPGENNSGLKAEHVERYMRRAQKHTVMETVIEKVVAKYRLTAGMSYSLAKRFGAALPSGVNTHLKLSVGPEKFDTGLSAALKVSNQPTDSENELMQIGELLPDEKNNYFAFTFNLRENIEEDLAREYFQGLYNDRQLLRSLKAIDSDFKGLEGTLDLVSWKYRVCNRQVHIFAIINFPTVLSIIAKKFDPLTPFLDPALMNLSVNLSAESQTDFPTLAANFPSSVFDSIVSNSRVQADIHICPETMRLINLFSQYSVTASSAQEKLPWVTGFLGLVGKGSVEMQVPSADTLSVSIIDDLRKGLSEFLSEFINELNDFATRSHSGTAIVLVTSTQSYLNTFLSVIDPSEVQVNAGYNRLRLEANLKVPRLSELLSPPVRDFAEFLKSLQKSEKPN